MLTECKCLRDPAEVPTQTTESWEVIYPYCFKMLNLGSLFHGNNQLRDIILITKLWCYFLLKASFEQYPPQFVSKCTGKWYLLCPIIKYHRNGNWILRDKNQKGIYKLLCDIFRWKAICNYKILLHSLRTAILREKEVLENIIALSLNFTASISLTVNLKKGGFARKLILVKASYVKKSGTDFVSILTKLQKIWKVSLIPNAHVQHDTHSNYLLFTNEI